MQSEYEAFPFKFRDPITGKCDELAGWHRSRKSHNSTPSGK